MDELMKILQELEPDVNYREEQALIAVSYTHLLFCTG